MNLAGEGKGGSMQNKVVAVVEMNLIFEIYYPMEFISLTAGFG